MAVSEEDFAGAPAPLQIRYEQAVIIWDEQHKVEHFIRQAEFFTPAHNVGFIVPTPATPEVAEANPRIFASTANFAHPIAEPPTLYRPPNTPFWTAFSLPLSTAGFIRPPPDNFQGEQNFPPSLKNTGALNATVFDASDLKGIRGWFDANHFSWQQANEDWLKVYAAKGWKVTALQLTGKPDMKGINPVISCAVRLSFPADKPYYPYFEPKSTQLAHVNTDYKRRLNVAFISDHRVDGKLAEGALWPAQLFFAGHPGPGDQVLLTDANQPVSVEQNGWLADAHLQDSRFPAPTFHWITYFRDSSNPRPGTSDVVFAPSVDQNFYQAHVIDDSLPLRHALNLTNIWDDLFTLLEIVALAGAPLYAGFRVLAICRRARQNEHLLWPGNWSIILDPLCAFVLLACALHLLGWGMISLGLIFSLVSALIGLPFLALVVLFTGAVLYAARTLANCYRLFQGEMTDAFFIGNLRWARISAVGSMIIGVYFAVLLVLAYSGNL